jgi:hypothetical protein
VDIDGAPVEESGRSREAFDLIVNKNNIEVATNPGQFYFNAAWWNKGSTPRTVSVNMPEPGLVNFAPHGRQAVHSALFQGDLKQTNFQSYFACANDGEDCYSTPHGNTGQTAPIAVPSLATLLVTYHLEWSRTRQTFPAGCVSTLGGYRCPIGALGVISEGATEIARCSASATAYPK